jgi:diguanylate cyclase (GGDEF)-like protein
MLIIEDDVPSAELTARTLNCAGVSCAHEVVATEAEFRNALARAPDIIVSDSNVPGFDGLAALSIAREELPRVPFIFFSGSEGEGIARRALKSGAAAYVPKSKPEGLPAAVRSALESIAEAKPRVPEKRRRAGALDASGAAEYLLERRAVLDRTLRHEDASAMSSIMRRMPPHPVALVMIEAQPAHERFVKLLGNANIDIDAARDPADALAKLASRVHALLFTDCLNLISEARKLHAGAATHIVFIDRGGKTGAAEALRAGANDIMSDEPRGEQFWAHLTTARRIVSLAESLQLALTDNRILSTIDELTRCGSRRFFEHQFPREVARAVRLRHPLALVTCDIDHFKNINDSHGHPVGDEVLREFADRIINGLRLGEDWVARVGGEEFAVVLPEAHVREALAIAHRLCQRVSSRLFEVSRLSLRVTASFGVCALEDPYVHVHASAVPDLLVKAADAALYQSKRTGRNRVTFASLKPGASETSARAVPLQ